MTPAFAIILSLMLLFFVLLSNRILLKFLPILLATAEENEWTHISSPYMGKLPFIIDDKMLLWENVKLLLIQVKSQRTNPLAMDSPHCSSSECEAGFSAGTPNTRLGVHSASYVPVPLL